MPDTVPTGTLDVFKHALAKAQRGVSRKQEWELRLMTENLIKSTAQHHAAAASTLASAHGVAWSSDMSDYVVAAVTAIFSTAQSAALAAKR